MKRKQKTEMVKFVIFLLIITIIVWCGTTISERVFWSTMYWLFVFFLIPFWLGHIFFYKNRVHPKRHCLHVFFGWGVSLFGICWAIGLISGIWTVPHEIINNPNEWLYLKFLLSNALKWALIGGISIGLIAMLIQYHSMVKTSH